MHAQIRSGICQSGLVSLVGSFNFGRPWHLLLQLQFLIVVGMARIIKYILPKES
jgi:hypothetical protein